MRLVILALLCVVLLGCHDPQQGMGVPDKNYRIVVLSPAAGVTLRDLGLADMVVGRHAFDVALDPALPVCGDLGTIDYERVIAARPTHVIVQWHAGGMPDRLVALAGERGWELVSVNPLSLADVRASVIELGRIFGARAQSEALAAMMDAAWTHVDAQAGVGRVLLIATVGRTYGVPGPGSFHHELLVRAGATPAVEDGSPWQQLDAEDIVRIAPDGIVLIETDGAREGSRWDEIESRLGGISALPLPAVRSRRVAIVSGQELNMPSTSMIGLAERLKAVVRGWNTGDTEADGG